MTVQSAFASLGGARHEGKSGEDGKDDGTD